MPTRMGMGGPHGMRSFLRDRSVVDHRVKPGTAARMARFAQPYRRLIVWFLVLVVINAILGAVNPLIIGAFFWRGSSSWRGSRACGPGPQACHTCCA